MYTYEQQKKVISEVNGLYECAEMIMEECAELIRACSKYLRINGEGVPTGDSVESIYSNLAEEIADVRICIDEFLLGKPGISEEEIAKWERNKIERRLCGILEETDSEELREEIHMLLPGLADSKDFYKIIFRDKREWIFSKECHTISIDGNKLKIYRKISGGCAGLLEEIDLSNIKNMEV